MSGLGSVIVHMAYLMSIHVYACVMNVYACVMNVYGRIRCVMRDIERRICFLFLHALVVPIVCICASRRSPPHSCDYSFVLYLV